MAKDVAIDKVNINRCVYIRTMNLICTRLSGMKAGIQVPRMAPSMPIHIRVNWIPVSLPGRRHRSTTAITYATINSIKNDAKDKAMHLDGKRISK